MIVLLKLHSYGRHFNMHVNSAWRAIDSHSHSKASFVFRTWQFNVRDHSDHGT